MGYLCEIRLIGNVGRDAPTVIEHQNGVFAEFSIATTKRIGRDDDGKPRSRTTWHRVKIYNKALIENVIPHVRPGAQIYVAGELAYDNWRDRDDIQRKEAFIELRHDGKIELLSGKRSDDTAGEKPTRTVPGEGRAA